MNELDQCYLEALSEALKGNLGEALELRNEADALASEGFSFSENYGNKYPFIEEAVNTLLGSFDFTRCVRADGSAYGTGGACRKGVEQAKTSENTAWTDEALNSDRLGTMWNQPQIRKTGEDGPEVIDRLVKKTGDKRWRTTPDPNEPGEYLRIIHPEYTDKEIIKLREAARNELKDERGKAYEKKMKEERETETVSTQTKPKRPIKNVGDLLDELDTHETLFKYDNDSGGFAGDLAYTVPLRQLVQGLSLTKKKIQKINERSAKGIGGRIEIKGENANIYVPDEHWH
jgi:hypothetical protein